MMRIVDINRMVYLTFGILSTTGFNSMCSSFWLYCTGKTNSQWVLATLAFTENNILLFLLPGPISTIDELAVAVFSLPFLHHMQMVSRSVEEDALQTLLPRRIIHNQQRATIQQVVS